MNCINLTIKGQHVQLVIHDSGFDGPSYDVFVIINRWKYVRFARFRDLFAAQLYLAEYQAYYRGVKFFISRSIF